MSLVQLESQIEALRAQAENVQKRWSRTRDSIQKDNTLTDIGKQQKIDAEREQVSARLSDLRKQESELVASTRRSLEKRLFGLGAADSTYTDKVMSFRDAQDRAARLERWSDAEQLLTSAFLSEDKILATAVLRHALDNEWRSVVNKYITEYPRSGDDLKDLAEIRAYTPMAAGFSYITT
jgi:chromosome segregation ATPase